MVGLIVETDKAATPSSERGLGVSAVIPVELNLVSVINAFEVLNCPLNEP